MTNKPLPNGPSILDLDDRDDSSRTTDFNRSWGESSSEFGDRSKNQHSVSSWDDSTSDGSGGGYGFLE